MPKKKLRNLEQQQVGQDGQGKEMTRMGKEEEVMVVVVPSLMMRHPLLLMEETILLPLQRMPREK